jgi:membrane-associated protease RseP (regulator of RpoE activity)
LEYADAGQADAGRPFLPSIVSRESTSREFTSPFATTFAPARWPAQPRVDIFSDPFGVEQDSLAITLMTILLSHEMGHYVMARAHRVDASLPYFLPAPPLFWFGTFGAFIRMRTMPPHRRALFDIGAAGPWAGFVVAVPALVVGLSLSTVQPLQPHEGGLILGDSLLFSWLTHAVLGVSSDEVTVLLHPIARMVWAAMTCLNPSVGQLG